MSNCSNDTENLQSKEDKTNVVGSETSTSEQLISNQDSKETTEQTEINTKSNELEQEQESNNDNEHHDVNFEQAQPLTGGASSSTKTQPQSSVRTRLNAHFQQKTKIFREIMNQNRLNELTKMNKQYTQLMIPLFLTIVGVICGITALSTNGWTCDSNHSYGIFDTCFSTSSQPSQSVESNNSIEINNETITPKAINIEMLVCAKQLLNQVKIEPVEQTQIDNLSASQGLIICGVVFNFLSTISMSIAYRFIQMKNLNSVRNFMLMSMFVQIFSILVGFIGFFLYMWPETISLSIGCLFGYFASSIIVTNFHTFFTIEYKMCKMRKVTC